MYFNKSIPFPRSVYIYCSWVFVYILEVMGPVHVDKENIQGMAEENSKKNFGSMEPISIIGMLAWIYSLMKIRAIGKYHFRRKTTGWRWTFKEWEKV